MYPPRVDGSNRERPPYVGGSYGGGGAGGADFMERYVSAMMRGMAISHVTIVGGYNERMR